MRLSVRKTGLDSTPRQIRNGKEVLAHVMYIRDRDEWYWATQPTSGRAQHSTHVAPFHTMDAALADALKWLRAAYKKQPE